MIITLTGNNSYALHKRLNGLVGDFLKKNGDFALERIDAEESDSKSILEAVQSIPFLSERKMVVVRNLGSNKQAAEQIEQIIDSAGDTTDLILYEPTTDKRTAYYKTIKSKTQLEELVELDQISQAKWLVDEAKNSGAALALDDAKFLIDRVGVNQALLSNELVKLITYNSNITRDNIELLCEPTPQSKIFELLDAAFSGNKSRALNLYDDQRAQKVEPQEIMALLVWQLQILAVAKYGKGKSANEIAKDAGMSPFPINKALSLVSKIPETNLRNMVSEAYNIDLRSKTTAIDLDEALKTFIATL